MPNALLSEQQIHISNVRDDYLAPKNRGLGPDERQPSCFAFEDELGEGWDGSGAQRPLIIEARPTL